MYRSHGLILCLFLSIVKVNSQDTLPDFKLLNKGNNRIIVSWVNPYGSNIRQLSIQRSAESSRNFRTILTLPDPTVPENGFADTKAPNDKSFYRIYILLDSGKYVFSKPKRPVLDTGTADILVGPADILPKDPVVKDVKNTAPASKAEPERIIYIKRRDTLIARVAEHTIKRYRDSVSIKTKDTISYFGPDTLVIRPFVPKEIFKPSKYIFTDKEGNVKMVLPEAGSRKYLVRFFDEDNAPFFEIKKVTGSDLIIDKSNFLRSGWFKFELYEDEQLKEKNKLYISKIF